MNLIKDNSTRLFDHLCTKHLHTATKSFYLCTAAITYIFNCISTAAAGCAPLPHKETLLFSARAELQQKLVCYA